MPRLRYADLVRKPMGVLDMTSLTPDACQILVPPFEVAFQAHMAEWRLDGKPRTARRFTTYTNCPIPVPSCAIKSTSWLDADLCAGSHSLSKTGWEGVRLNRGKSRHNAAPPKLLFCRFIGGADRGTTNMQLGLDFCSWRLLS